MNNLVDERAGIEPDHFSYRPLPSDPDDGPAISHEVVELMKAHGVKHMRMTIVSDSFPNEPYPHGLYYEGWSIAPWDHEPPGKEAPFNYPLTAESEPNE